MAKPMAIMIKKINTEKELLVFIMISSNYLITYKSNVLLARSLPGGIRTLTAPPGNNKFK